MGRTSVVVTFLVVALATFSFLSVREHKNNVALARFETSPCGIKLYSGNYVLGEKSLLGKVNPFEYTDDGERVWKIKRIYFKNFSRYDENPEPEIEWEVVMERTPENCLVWINKTGIDLRNKINRKKYRG